MKKVCTLDNDMLAAACRQLEALCPKPDLVVGIANGGVHVADLMFADVAHASVGSQRPSTAAKRRRWLRKAVRALPYPALDAIRNVEAWWLGLKKPSPAHIQIDDATSKKIRGCKCILIVDDAVDSGATLASVTNAVMIAAQADTKLITAALVLTTKRPIITPDFYLYDDILLRFPWSMDYK